MKQTLLSLALLMLTVGLNAQSNSSFFPTRMTWQEQMLSLDSEEPEWGAVETFEIGTDTIINGQTYKQVKCDGNLEPVWVREQDNMVWLLTNLSQQEIKLYDFNWDNQQEVTTEYLQDSGEGFLVSSESFMTNNASSTFLNGTNMQYYREGIARTTICGIGNVIELNRCDDSNHKFYSLLGYCMPQVALPGMTFKKVISIQRNGEEIYRSDSADDWIFVIPNGIKNMRIDLTSNTLFDLQGRPVQGSPKHGVYIQNGKKVMK